VHTLALSAASVAVQITGVVPSGKIDAEAGVQTTLIGPGTLSVAEAAKVTTAEHWSGSVLCTTLSGQWIVGGTVSRMLTDCVVTLLAETGSTVAAETVAVFAIVPTVALILTTI